MSASGLLDHFTRCYASLKSSLTRRQGNADMASHAPRDTWGRLQGMESLPERERAGAYLMRVALNIVVDGQRRETLYATREEVGPGLDQHMHAAPGSARTAQARLDLGILLRQVEHMPERRRVILVMAHWEDLTRQEIAHRLKISVRTVDTELKRAHERLAEFFGETQK